MKQYHIVREGENQGSGGFVSTFGEIMSEVHEALLNGETITINKIRNYNSTNRDNRSEAVGGENHDEV